MFKEKLIEWEKVRSNYYSGANHGTFAHEALMAFAAWLDDAAAQQSVQRTCAKSPDGNHHFEPGESSIVCEYCGASR